MVALSRNVTIRCDPEGVPMKTIRNILFFFSIFLLYFVVREAISLFDAAFSLSPILGYAVLVLLAAVFLWFLLLPLMRILLMPRNPGPVGESGKEEALIAKRLALFRKNPYLKSIGFVFDPSKSEREQYDSAVAALNSECDRMRKEYVRRIFYGSTISQNGFLDAVLILSSGVNLIKDTFVLYSGRVSLKDLLTIGRMVYYSTVIGGSESVEYLTEELFSKLASDSLKGIPFLGRITGSIADGFVNAALLTRISMIAENYCSMTLITKRSDLYPKFQAVYSTTKHIVSGLLGDAKDLAKDKAGRGFLGRIGSFFGRGGDDEELQPEGS